MRTLIALLFAIIFSFSVSGQNSKADEHLKKAGEYFAKRQCENAISEYSKAIDLDGDLIAAYHNRGSCYHTVHDFDKSYLDFKKAIELYTKAIARKPDVNLYYNRGLLYANLREYILAIADYERIMSLDPKEADAYFYRAEAYERLLKTDLGKADRLKYTAMGGTLPTPQPRRDFYPEGTFDPEAARLAFGRGNSIIRGIVCTKYNNRVYRANGATVSLFPATPYLEQWYALRDKKAGRDRAVFMSTEAVRWRVEVTANEEGRFQFADLKPGRYFLQVFHNFRSGHSGRDFVGSSTEVVNGLPTRVNYYEDYDYTVDHSGRIEKFVNLKHDGEDVKVTLMRGGGLIKLGGCL